MSTTNLPQTKWPFFLKDKGLFWVTCCALSHFAVFFFIAAFRYFTLQYHDWDFALSANAMHNIIHGKAFISIYDRHFLGNHFNLIAFVIAPFYFIFRTPLFLLLLKDLSISLTAIPLYLLAKRKFDPSISALFAVMFLAYPALSYVLLYEFHFEDLSILFLTLSFFFLYTGNNLWFFAASLLSLSCKENIPLVTAAMGFYALLFRPRRRILGLVILILSLTYFAALTLWWQPSFTPDISPGYARHYSHYGKSFADIFAHIFLHPLAILKDVLAKKENITFLKDLFSPLGYLPLLRPDMLIMIFPILLKNLLSRNLATHTIYWHYTAPMIPFLVISMMWGVKKISRSAAVKKKLLVLCLAVLSLELFMNVRLYARSHLFVRYQTKLSTTDIAKLTALRMIRPKSSAIATFDFLPQLSQRKDIYTFYMLWRPRVHYARTPDTEYALVDFNDHFLERDFALSPSRVANALRSYTRDKRYGVVFAHKDIVLLKKDHPSQYPLLEIQDLPRHDMPQTPFLSIDDSLQLINFESFKNPDDQTMRFSFYWNFKRPSGSLYEILFFVTHKDEPKLIARHSLGYRFDTSTLRADQVLKENYWFSLPSQIKSRNANFSIAFRNVRTGKIADVKTYRKNFLFKGMVVQDQN